MTIDNAGGPEVITSPSRDVSGELMKIMYVFCFSGTCLISNKIVADWIEAPWPLMTKIMLDVLMMGNITRYHNHCVYAEI